MESGSSNVRTFVVLLVLVCLVVAVSPGIALGSRPQVVDPWLAEEQNAQQRGDLRAPDVGQETQIGEPMLHEGHILYDPQTGETSDDPTVTVSAIDSPEEQARLAEYLEQKRTGLEPGRLRFRSGYTLEPQAGIDPEVLEELAGAREADAGEGYYVIQFSYPFPTEARLSLEEAGVVFYDYVDVGGLYARVPSQALEILQAMVTEGLIRYVGPIPAEAKVDPALLSDVELGAEVEEMVTLLTFDEPTSAQLEQLAAWFSVERRSDGPMHILEGRASRASIASLSNLAFVRWVEAQQEITLGNLDGGMGIASDVVRNSGWDGSGIQVMVVDSGIARSGTTYHPDLLGGRIVDQYDYQDGDIAADDQDSHGTHVASSIGGRYNSSSFYSERSWQGVAPGVDLLTYKLCCGTDQFSSTWFQQALQRATTSPLRAHISNNSWGGGNGLYTTHSEIADRAVRGEYNSKPINMVIISHNDNALTRAPGTGKNVITVGSIKDGNYPYDPFTYCGADEYDWPPAERVCYSNYGPIDTDGDGRTRVKPDVMAPGAMIYAAAPWYLYGDSRYYQFKHGTSMAAPHVSGAIAQILDAYSDSSPTLLDWPEIIKAMLLASTVDVGANTDLYGRGLIDPYHAIYYQSGIDASMRYWGSSFSTTGDTLDFTVNVPAGYEEVRIALTWADPAGSTEVANDLDIASVKDGAGAYVGASSSYDDPVEYVLVPGGYTPGTWTITVRAFSLSSGQRFGLAAHPILKYSDLGITASLERAAGEYFYLYQYLSNSGYTAAGAYARLWAPAGVTVEGVRIYTNDGHSHYYDDSEIYHPDGSSYWRAAVGEIVAGRTRQLRWFLSIEPAQECGLTLQSIAYWREAGSLYGTGATYNTVKHCIYLPVLLKNG